MAVRKIQAQPVYGAPSNRTYCRLRLPRPLAKQYVEEFGEWQYVWADSSRTLRIGGDDGGHPVHILRVREMRNAVYKHFWQVMFPIALSAEMRGGDEVDVTRDGDTLRLVFTRDIFGGFGRGSYDAGPLGNLARPEPAGG